MTRPIMHSHLTEHAAVARATAGNVLATVMASTGAPAVGTEHTRRGRYPRRP